MRYISTRGQTAPLAFSDAVITGLAPDGGLLVPERIPEVGGELEALSKLSFTGLAKAVLPRFIDDIPPSDLSQLVDAAYADFDCADVVELRQAGAIQVLELFHGPTLSFKDIALQFLGRLFAYILEARGERLNLLGATSGDTGSAAIAGVRGQPGINIFIMYPLGRVSRLQELQMTTVADANVHCLAIQGSFDDCQTLLKGVFGDLEFKRRLSLGAVNSVNWARVLAQVLYYGYASLRSPARPSFCVPTGNFGNVFAGYIAKRMGFPIDKLIVATNENDILSVFFASGLYRRGEVRFTISPAMDIQVASNFERFLHYHLDGDAAALRAFMADFQAKGEARLPPPGDEVFMATAVDAGGTLEAIREVHRTTGYVADPHTAVGLAAARRLSVPGPVICMGAAHPAKFPEAVNEAVGEPVAVHPALESLRGLPERCTVLKANVDEVKAFIKATVGPEPQRIGGRFSKSRFATFYIGIDLAWADGGRGRSNESGVVMLAPDGTIKQAGWCVGLEETLAWLEKHAPEDVRLFIDAPLVVENAAGQRLCEKQVGQRYWQWKVSANSTNKSSPYLAGVKLLERLEARGWSYHDGVGGPPRSPGRFVSECYPYTTIVGARELGYATERPRYKRQPKHMPMSEFRPLRNAACDELIHRLSALKTADPPMDLSSHDDTRRLMTEKSPDRKKDYKHREDLLDAVLCAWTAALWDRWGDERCQVLGRDDAAPKGRKPTIIAPARIEQRPTA